jgi:ectoine hydroxylase-related dioxygenase (phytanoyl-CoA dioxygenase family)
VRKTTKKQKKKKLTMCRGTNRKMPPNTKDCIHAEMEKGDGLIFLSSVFHGGGNNTTADEHRLMFSTFAVRGYMRQEENQFLAVPAEKVKQYDRATQKFIGYAISDPACGYVEELDPIYTLYPEELKGVKPTDF